MAGRNVGDNGESAQIDCQDRRATTELVPDIEESAFSLGVAWIDTLLRGFRLSDILSARGHSEDFRDTRAEFINTRLRVMLVFYAAGIPLWIPVDYFTIPSEYFVRITGIRLIFSACLILLAFYTRGRSSLERVNVALALTILGTMLFYCVTVGILYSNGDAPDLAGYLSMPHLVVVMLGLFPLTIIDGVVMTLMVLGIFLIAKFWLPGDFYSFDTLNDFWLLLMLAGLMLWIQSGQLLMLLRLYRESTSDALTGLINRRVLMKRLDVEVARVMASGRRSFSILMFDLDRFKRVNDNYGHFTGDEVLKTASQVLKGNLRHAGLLARFGGEEFMAVLPGADGEAAVTVAERLRRTLEDTVVTAPGGDEIHLRTSIGVTEYQAGELIDETLSRADELLYSAKEQGRNRVVFSYGGLTGSPIDSAEPAFNER